MIDTRPAQISLDAYARRKGSASGGDRSHEDYQCDLVDLIADLFHLADQLETKHGLIGSGGEGASASAWNHYSEEVGCER